MEVGISLADLVKLAKQSPADAGTELLAILRDIFPDLNVGTITINAGSEVSLNSINGILTTDGGRRLFFKFHAEEGETQSMVGGEYYRAELLSKLGWNIIKPLAVSTKPGRQCLVYEERRDRTAYDMFGEQDDLYLRTGSYDDTTVKSLLAAEKEYLENATSIMLRTLEPASPETKNAPLLQLFSHRLNSAGGAIPRVDLFYTDKSVTLPDGNKISFNEIASKKWVINGRALPTTLEDIIGLSKTNLAADALALGPTVVSHGDDHNGNKFYVSGKFIAFDPAFAGRHPALLAPIKGIMHNGPLHPFWYYKPAHVLERVQVDFKLATDCVEVTHNADTVLASPLRRQIVDLHQEYALNPLLNKLAERKLLSENWKTVIKCAAFCCPFLAVNMIDASRVPEQPKLSLFNLAKCMEAFHMQL